MMWMESRATTKRRRVRRSTNAGKGWVSRVLWRVAWTTLVVSTPAFAIEGYPGSMWGRVHSELDGVNGDGAIGYINQGIDWADIGGIRLNTFLEYRYRLRTQREDSYNAYGPAVGVALKKGSVRAGINYHLERFPKLGDTDEKVTLFIEWYVDWDGMNRK